MKETKWIRLLAYVTGLVNQELLCGWSQDTLNLGNRSDSFCVYCFLGESQYGSLGSAKRRSRPDFD